MIFRSLFLVFASLYLHAAAAESDRVGFFYLTNGDVVQGKQTLLNETSLQFSAPTFGSDVELKPEDLLAWRSVDARQEGVENLSRIHLQGGEPFDVKILRLADGWLEVETAWGEGNAIRVSDLARIILPRPETPIYLGPQPLSDLLEASESSTSTAGWVEADGGVFSVSEIKGPLAVPLKDAGGVYRIAVEIVPGGEVDLSMDLAGKGPREAGPDRIIIRQRQEELLFSSQSPFGSPISGSAVLPDFRSEPYRVELYVNIPQNLYALRWNGVRVREWRDRPAEATETFSFDTLSLRFSGNAPVLVREITVSRWDGTLPSDREASDDRIRVLFRNQDSLMAKNIKIEEGTLGLTQADDSAFNLPLARVEELNFPTQNGARQALEPSVAELRLAFPGNWLRVTGIEIRDGTLYVEHASFRDPLRIPLKKVQGIQWKAPAREQTTAAVEGSTLRLLSGEIVRGEFLTFTDAQLKFRPDWGETELAAPLAAVRSLSFAGDETVADTPHRFRFQNRDTFRGTLQEVDEEEITLRSPWGEALRLNRKGLLEISRVGGAQGDWIDRWGVDADWQMSQGWRPNLESPDSETQSIARRGMVYARRLPDSPERVMLDLPLEGSASLGLLFNLYASGPTRGSPLEGVEVNIASRQISLRAPGGFEFFNFERIPNEPNRLQFFFDPELDRITVFLNDEELAARDIPFPKDLETRWMWFQSLSRDFPTEGLQVQPWSGQPNPGQPPVEARKGDELQLADNRRFSGRLLPSVNDQLVFMPEGGDEALAALIQEMLLMRFSSEAQSKPEPTPRDVQVAFRGEAQPMTLTLEEGDAQRIVGTGDVWRSPVSLPLTFIESITFNSTQRRRNDQMDGPPRWISVSESDTP
ncbi:MAG: hypothetical protein JJU29_17710 [Verrucomicrobia bacterium]|nr:hypothetical protein [Verrucomicrobiota bacterium]MCH8513920.1 hypothetical protein [Kiritimatiellia bacterium]